MKKRPNLLSAAVTGVIGGLLFQMQTAGAVEITIAATDPPNTIVGAVGTSSDPWNDPLNLYGREPGNFRNSEASIVKIGTGRYIIMHSRFYGGYRNAAGVPCLDDHQHAVMSGGIFRYDTTNGFRWEHPSGDQQFKFVPEGKDTNNQDLPDTSMIVRYERGPFPYGQPAGLMSASLISFSDSPGDFGLFYIRKEGQDCAAVFNPPDPPAGAPPYSPNPSVRWRTWFEPGGWSRSRPLANHQGYLLNDSVIQRRRSPSDSIAPNRLLVALGGRNIHVAMQDMTIDYDADWTNVVTVPNSTLYQEPMLVECADETATTPATILMLLRGNSGNTPMGWSKSTDRGNSWSAVRNVSSSVPTKPGVPQNVKLLSAANNHLLLLYQQPNSLALLARVLPCNTQNDLAAFVSENVIPGSDVGGGVEFRYPSLFIDDEAGLVFITYSVGHGSYMSDLRMQVLPVSWFYF